MFLRPFSSYFFGQALKILPRKTVTSAVFYVTEALQGCFWLNTLQTP